MRLNFTPVDKAFTLGSSQIKDTQEEIANLTKLILESNKPLPSSKPKQKTENENEHVKNQSRDYMRVGYPDQQHASFKPPTENDIDYNLMKVIGHPKFEDIVKNYALIYHPEWLLKETSYEPKQNTNNISYFGNKYQSTVCSEVQKYIIFFISSVIVFILLSILL
jgi:hypothetical protein